MMNMSNDKLQLTLSPTSPIAILIPMPNKGGWKPWDPQSFDEVKRMIIVTTYEIGV